MLWDGRVESGRTEGGLWGGPEGKGGSLRKGESEVRVAWGEEEEEGEQVCGEGRKS